MLILISVLVRGACPHIQALMSNVQHSTTFSGVTQYERNTLDIYIIVIDPAIGSAIGPVIGPPGPMAPMRYSVCSPLM